MASFLAFWVSKNVVFRPKILISPGAALHRVSLKTVGVSKSSSHQPRHQYKFGKKTLLQNIDDFRFQTKQMQLQTSFSVQNIHPNPEKSFGPNLGHPNVGEEEAELTPGYLSIVNLSFGVSSL